MQIPIDDRGLLLGDGLFETVLAERGELVAFEAHAARMVRGCAVLGLPAPAPKEAEATAMAALLAAGLANERAAVRLTWTAGSGGRGLDRPQPLQPRLLAAAAPAPQASEPLRLLTAQVRRNEHSPASRLKTLAYLDNVLARREAREAGADEALMLNTRGEAACAAAANLFWIKEDRLYTPALVCGVLDGVMRAAVLGTAAALGVETAEVRAGPKALAEAEAFFLTNSLMGVRRVGALDARPTPGHRLIDRLAGALA
jgi:branched-chain amino acid aminotransferase/4-amino-4-deoxychorismate lyase